MTNLPIALAVESSCDETAAAIVRADGAVLADRLASQHDLHALYGGVVPEIAARAHLGRLDRLIAAAMADAGLGFADLDLIAATAGPGLIGGVMAGWATGRAIAQARGLPFYPINHLEGHALTARLTDGLAFPYLFLLASGGHTELLWVAGVGRYRKLGGTIDDALGEAFDKVAKMLGLGFPGGPAVERRATAGDCSAFRLPRSMVGRPEPDFSLSGLKTAVRQAALAEGDRIEARIDDLCASFQAAVGEIVCDRIERAIAILEAEGETIERLVIAGGVAANAHLRSRIAQRIGDRRFVAPPARLCADNAVMIAWAALERARLGPAPLDPGAPRARWPLAELTPPSRPASGAGA